MRFPAHRHVAHQPCRRRGAGTGSGSGSGSGRGRFRLPVLVDLDVNGDGFAVLVHIDTQHQICQIKVQVQSFADEFQFGTSIRDGTSGCYRWRRWNHQQATGAAIQRPRRRRPRDWPQPKRKKGRRRRRRRRHRWRQRKNRMRHRSRCAPSCGAARKRPIDDRSCAGDARCPASASEFHSRKIIRMRSLLESIQLEMIILRQHPDTTLSIIRPDAGIWLDRTH